jgi:hypothetical protein
MTIQRHTPCTDLPDIMDFDDEGEWVRFTDAQAAIDAAYDRALEDAARVVDCNCRGRDDVLASPGPNSAARWRACGQDMCGAIEAAALRAMKKGTTDEA